MASVYLMNGTNTVGMNGTNTVGMNGTNTVGMNGTGFYSTNQVQPLNLMNGTNSVTLNGTNSVTLNGMAVEDLNPLDIELNGIDADESELDAIRLALAYGDPEIIEAYETGELNGLKDIIAARRARIANETPQDKAARVAKRKALIGGVLQLASSAVPGASGVGAKLAQALQKGASKAQTLQTAVEKAMILENAGIQPEVNTLTTRAAVETESGLPAVEDQQLTGLAKLKATWNGYSPVTKAAIIGGVGLAGFLVYRQFFAKKKKRK